MQNPYNQSPFSLQPVLNTILDTLTPDDLRHLIETVDEDSRRGNFQRVFPNHTSHKYLRYFEQPRYYNLLVDAWTQQYHRNENDGESVGDLMQALEPTGT